MGIDAQLYLEKNAKEIKSRVMQLTNQKYYEHLEELLDQIFYLSD